MHGDPIHGVDPTGLSLLGSTLGSLSTGLKITALSAGAGATVYTALGRSPLEGAYVGGMGGLGWAIAPRKGEAMLMGFLSAGLEVIVEYLDDDGARGRSLLADGIKAFSEGVFDAGFDGWAKGFRLTPNTGTIVGDGTISGAPFAGVLAPLIVLGRATVGKQLEPNGGGPLSREEAIAAFIEATVTYVTNQSGLGAGMHLPASVRTRAGELAAKLILLPPGQSYTDFAKAAAKSIDERFLVPFSEFVTGAFGRWLEETPEEDIFGG